MEGVTLKVRFVPAVMGKVDAAVVVPPMLQRTGVVLVGGGDGDVFGV
jgi:hypothetical protein